MEKDPQLLETGKRYGRQSEKEGEACRIVALEIEEKGRRQGRAGTGNARDQCSHLGETDDHCVAKPHVSHAALMAAQDFRKGEEKAHRDACPTDDRAAAPRRAAAVERGCECE